MAEKPRMKRTVGMAMSTVRMTKSFAFGVTYGVYIVSRDMIQRKRALGFHDSVLGSVAFLTGASSMASWYSLRMCFFLSLVVQMLLFVLAFMPCFGGSSREEGTKTASKRLFK